MQHRDKYDKDLIRWANDHYWDSLEKNYKDIILRHLRTFAGEPDIIMDKTISSDLDLPPDRRTQANLWKSKYYEMYVEVVKANKGLRRLTKKNERLKKLFLNP